MGDSVAKLMILLSLVVGVHCYDAQNKIPPADEVFCAIICEDKGTGYKFCEWEYKTPKYIEQSGQTYLNWEPYNIDRSKHSGTMNDQLQCTHIFQDGFPADEIAAQDIIINPGFSLR